MLPVRATILLAVIVKNLIFLSAQITAKVQKRQVSVLKSKYSKYCASGLTIKHEMIARIAAITRTIFFDTKSRILDFNASNKLKILR